MSLVTAQEDPFDGDGEDDINWQLFCTQVRQLRAPDLQARGWEFRNRGYGVSSSGVRMHIPSSAFLFSSRSDTSVRPSKKGAQILLSSVQADWEWRFQMDKLPLHGVDGPELRKEEARLLEEEVASRP